MARTIIITDATSQMGIYEKANSILREEHLRGPVEIEVVDGVLVVHSQNTVSVLFRTGVFATFNKSAK